jgi:hypothetical protein
LSCFAFGHLGEADEIRESALVCGLRNLLEQVSDDFVAVRRHPDPQVRLHAPANHPRPNVRFARTRRPLDGQNTADEFRDQPECSLQRGLAR